MQKPAYSLKHAWGRGDVNKHVKLQVSLPAALVGGSSSDDPEIKRLNAELKEVNRKILNGELDIPPEGERSPSPEPVYDRNGQRLNTRCACLSLLSLAARVLS